MELNSRKVTKFLLAGFIAYITVGAFIRIVDNLSDLLFLFGVDYKTHKIISYILLFLGSFLFSRLVLFILFNGKENKFFLRLFLLFGITQIVNYAIFFIITFFIPFSSSMRFDGASSLSEDLIFTILEYASIYIEWLIIGLTFYFYKNKNLRPHQTESKGVLDL